MTAQAGKVNKQLQYKYWRIPQEVKTIHEIKFGQLIEHNIAWDISFFLKNNTQNAVEILLPDPFLRSQNWPYLWINSVRFYKACFYCMTNWGLS